jgi:hypothetical protein
MSIITIIPYCTLMQMKKIKIDKEQYYAYHKIITTYNVSYKKSSSNFLKKYNVPKNMYMYATKHKNEFKKLSKKEIDTRRNTTLIINAKYFDDVFLKVHKPKILEYNEDNSESESESTSQDDGVSSNKRETSQPDVSSDESDTNEAEDTINVSSDESNTNEDKDTVNISSDESSTDDVKDTINISSDESSTDEDNKDKKIIQPVPDTIKLLKKEKLKDSNGNVINIKVVGTREYNKCYFSVYDISRGLGIKKLHDTIIHKTSSYCIDEHYTYFMTKESKKKKLFLTYFGFLKVLFTTKIPTIKKFLTWCIEIIFVHHMGTDEQKMEMYSKIPNIPVSVFRKVVNLSSMPTSCIYLIAVCPIKKFKDELKLNKKYSNAAIVYKWGCSEDFSLRLSQHKANYGNIKIVVYVPIDKKYKFKAEGEIKKFFIDNDMKMTVPDREEYASIKIKQIKMVKREYIKIANKYKYDIDHIIDDQNKKEIEYDRKLSEKEFEIKDLQNSLLRKDNELLQKDNELLKKENELIKKENELTRVRYELDKLKIKKNK